LDSARVPRPCRGVGGKTPPPFVGELRHLLQRGAHAPCAQQGYSAPSTCTDSRAYRISHLARRSPSGKFLTRTSMARVPAFDTKKFGPIVSGTHRGTGLSGGGRRIRTAGPP